ncbi:putative Actin cytoskeleton-regulatory complex protein pan1 [Glarea lozoyensis 74030]|uniref:Putative Actin cytoskeleton-regulatory complex protein pan1 n=1 Tax=Glarea lozoyensis (strain ATCC 74030 / MF5533) TaxID=1104152 RepID=H0ENX1_GLAL7|nr:putative Actin cytoskeleton-regulatory complex protein pan1 [Glarea lozoyensis 74030]
MNFFIFEINKRASKRSNKYNPSRPASLIPQQFQNQNQAPPQPPAPAPMQKPQATGFAQMADSFRTTPAASASRGRRGSKSKAGTKIPNIRLSFITAQDQAKFETLFKSADIVRYHKIWPASFSRIRPVNVLVQSRVGRKTASIRIARQHQERGLDANECTQLQSDKCGLPSYNSTAAAYAFELGTAHLPNDGLSWPEQFQSRVSGTRWISTACANRIRSARRHAVKPNWIPAEYVQSLSYWLLRTSTTNATYADWTQSSSGAVSGADWYGQPTGVPGQWGLVNAPASGLPNIDLLQSRMMPQQGREQGSFTTSGLAGNAVIPWAVTKDEKQRYDAIFKAWDGFNKGFIGGDVAIEVFGQSGLAKSDMERVWTLADHGNKGRLNMDEFAVAMHLIYRKLNNYPLPAQLPPELVPPSTRNFNDSIGAVKNLLHQESAFRKDSGASLLPQKTGVSYLKNHSFRGSNSPAAGRKDATVFKNNDDDVGYKSSARRRLGGSGSPRPDSPSSTTSSDDLSLEQLRKRIREKQVLLDAIDFKDENAADEDDALDRRDRREADDLYHRIRRIQEDIDSHPDSALRNVDSGAERRALKRQLQNLTDKLPEIASQVRRTERSIAEARLELFRLKDAKAHPGSASTMVGTGPGGSVTESDRLKARARAMVQQRTAALTGKKITTSEEDFDAPKRLEEENVKIRNEREQNESMVKQVEEGVREYSRILEDSLQEGAESSSNEHEKRRWEDGLGVEDEVKEFIFDLQRSSRSAKVRKDDRRNTRDATRSERPEPSRYESPSSSARDEAPAAKPAATPAAGGTYSQYKTPEDRAAYIKQQAEQRMAERLAALGIKAPSKGGESTQQRLEREKNERAAKVRQAEEEDNRREAERQARLNEEQGIPAPSAAPAVPEPRGSKKPPPPPTRKAAKSDASERRAEEEQRVLEEQKAQIIATQSLETRDDAARQEREFAAAREAADAKAKALEEALKAKKINKAEAKLKKKAAEKEAKEKEARLAAQRAEIEAAQARERELQRQLEALDDDDSDSSSDDEGPHQATPQASTPTQGSQELERKEISPPPAPAPPVPTKIPPIPVAAITTSIPTTSPQAEAETKNPFLKKLAQTGTETPSNTSNNPFHRIPSQETPKAPEPLITQPTGARNRARPEEDDWSVVGSDKEDDSSDEEGPGAGNARHLASILFGTMGPPRPLSAAGTGPGSTPTSPAPARDSPAAAPPPPPMPTGGAPPPPPMPNAPPPPPMFGAPAPPPPPPPPASAPAGMPAARPQGLLGEIQMGRQLRKTVTKDSSTPAVAGVVLN